MVWTRPAEPSIPTLYYTFQAKDADSDDLVTYRVEDPTRDRYEDIIQHYLEHFVLDEPFYENRQLAKDKLAVEDIVSFWRRCLAEHMSIVCYNEGSREIVGANLLYVKTPEKLSWEIKIDRMRDVLVTNEYMTDEFNVFERHGVQRYLTAYGLAINGRYRGRGIATEMLKARVPFCKTFGITLTATVFTATRSQQAATSAGFVTDFEVTCEEFAKMGPEYSYPGIKTKSMKLMSLKIA